MNNKSNEKDVKSINENKLDNNYLTARNVSKYLNIPLSTVYRLSKQGKIRAVKIGKQWRYPKKVIEEYDLAGLGISNYHIRRADKSTDQRAFPRINCNLDCRYSINIPFRKRLNSQGPIYNISGNGVLLVDKVDIVEKVNIDDPISLDFNIVRKGVKTNIRAEGRVVRKNSIGLGVKFRDVSEDLRNAIVKYVG